jgi:hypothetical protein
MDLKFRTVYSIYLFKNNFYFLHLDIYINPLNYFNLPSYEHRLIQIFLQSLEARREIFSATFVFKILHDDMDSSILKDSIEINNNRLTKKENHYSTNYGMNK